MRRASCRHWPGGACGRPNNEWLDSLDEPDNEDGLNSEWLDDLDALDRDPLNECLDESRDSVGVSTKAS